MIDMDNPVLDLSAMDRCDRCGAQAIVLATREDQSDLLFCVHHIRDHKEKLYSTGWTLVLDGPMAEAAGYKDQTVINA